MRAYKRETPQSNRLDRGCNLKRNAKTALSTVGLLGAFTRTHTFVVADDATILTRTSSSSSHLDLKSPKDNFSVIQEVTLFIKKQT